MPDDRKYDFEAIPLIYSPNKTGLQSKLTQKLHKNCWDFLDFYRNAALIKYFTNNQYYVTDLIIQRINIDFQYAILHMWEKPEVRNPPVCQPAVLILSSKKIFIYPFEPGGVSFCIRIDHFLVGVSLRHFVIEKWLYNL